MASEPPGTVAQNVDAVFLMGLMSGAGLFATCTINIIAVKTVAW